jgi:hypothetical protein
MPELNILNNWDESDTLALEKEILPFDIAG